MSELRRNRPLMIDVESGGAWRHPWQLSIRYLAQEQAWGLTINPGFVNAGEVEVDVQSKTAPADTIERLGVERADGVVVRARITERPTIRVTYPRMRRIGTGATPTGVTRDSVTYEPVPDFFQSLGVREQDGQSFDPLTGFQRQQDGAVRDVEFDRQLYAFDVVLTQERAATATEWSGGAGIDGTFGQFDVTYFSDPDLRSTAYATVQRKFEALDNAESDAQEKLRGGWVDSGRDSLLIGTVYLLSPAGEGGFPNSRWSPYYRHNLFWNLNYATNLLPVSKPDTNLKFPLPLAGGAGQPTVNQILATINDEVDRLTEFLDQKTLKGTFWST